MFETFKRIWSFCKNRRGNLKKGLAFSFLRSIFGITQIFSIIIAINVVLGKADVKTSIFQIIALTLICIIGNFVTSYVEQLNTMNVGFFMAADKRISISKVLRNMPLGFFNNLSSGKICATLTTTLSGVETASVMVMVGIVSGLFNSICLFLFMLYYDFRIGIVTGIGMLAYLLIVNYEMKVSSKNAPMLQKAQNKLAEATLSFLEGIKVTKAFSFKEGDKNLKDAIEGSKDANNSLTKISMPSQVLAGLCIAVFESIILLMTVYLYFGTGAIDKIIVLMIFSFMAYVSLNQAGSMLSMIGLLDTGLAEVEQIEKEKQIKQEKPEQKAKDNEIIFKNVSFSYGDNEVLHNISTTIKPNTLNVLIGPSGSGKTTMCQLIPRFRDVNSGEITIGGANIKNMSEKELMQKISMVFQNVYLFEDTILNNIRFGKPNASLEEVRRVAKLASCDEFIMNLPEGSNTVLKEGGNTLSGGEKQRISIARAMLKDSPIVIIDEATSALDVENEHEILSAIDKLTKNKTVIMIAHRIKSAKNADHSIALRNGQIEQEGTHEELKDNKGLYKDFLNIRKEASKWKIEI